jgi:hypothetical protein
VDHAHARSDPDLDAPSSFTDVDVAVLGDPPASGQNPGPPVASEDRLDRIDWLCLIVGVGKCRGELGCELLDTLRSYGRARLADGGRLAAAENSLVDWAMAVTARLERDMRTERQDASLAAAVADRNSIRTALELQLSRGRYLDALRVLAAVSLDTAVERIHGFATGLVAALTAEAPPASETTAP